MCKDGQVSGSYGHLAIDVGSTQEVDSLCERMATDGIELVSAPRLTGDYYYEGLVKGPSGQLIEIIFKPPIKIEAISSLDLKEIWQLQRLCFQEEADRYSFAGLEPLTETFGDFCNRYLKYKYLKISVGHKLAGAVRAREDAQGCYIGRLIVAPQFRKRGFGQKLMQAIEREFPHAKRYEIYTGCLSKTSLNLVKKLGYQEFSQKQVHESFAYTYLERLPKRS
jgi:ribosomal protein S18 acetylase RimI-like enzyme